MSQKIKIAFLTILTLTIINCGVVFADASNDFDYVIQNNIPSFYNTEYYTEASNSLIGYENLVVISRYYYTFPGSEGDQITNRIYYTQFYIYGSNNSSYFDKSNNNAVVTPPPVMYLHIEFNHNTGVITFRNYGEKTTKQSFQLQNDANRKIVFSTKDINYYNSSTIYYPATDTYKAPYFEFAGNKIGTTTLENFDGNIPCFYPSSFKSYSNSYATYKRIGYLYIDKNYIISNIYTSTPTINVYNMTQTKNWQYTNYLIFTTKEEENGYIKYDINIDLNYINTPYIYSIELITKDTELGQTINIDFVLLKETQEGGGIVIESGDQNISGDFENTTNGDLQNTIESIFQKPNEEELKKEQEENINEIKDQITKDLEENKVFSALTTAEQGLIELLEGKPGDFKISWDPVTLKIRKMESEDNSITEQKLIPSGDVNFSELARENESIGYVKETLNIIMSGFMALNILKYIYNLILTTLGIDNPFIIERTSEPTTITETSTIKTKSGRTLTQTKKYKGGK